MEKRVWYSWLVDKPWKPFCLGLICIGVFAYVHDSEVGAWRELFFDILRDLGISLLLAAVVAGGIEIVARMERQRAVQDEEKRIKTNVLAAVVERDVPRQWLDFVVELLRKTDFIRNTLRVSMTLTRDEEASKKVGRPVVILGISSSFNVKNVSDKRAKYDVRVFIENPWDPALQDLVQLNEIVVNGEPLTPSQLDVADKAWDEDQNARKFLHEVWLESGEQAHIQAGYEMPKYDPDTSTWASIVPSEDLTMEVTGPAGMTVVVTPKHIARDRNDKLVKIATRTRKISFSIREPVFPYTVVEVNWSSPKALAKTKAG